MKNTSVITGALCSICFVVAANSAVAQAADGPPILYQPTIDSPIGAPNPKGPKELEQYAFLIGDWDAQITWIPANGEPVTYAAKWHNVWAINGMAIVQEWRGPYLTGQELRFYNPRAGHWVGSNVYPGNGRIKAVTAVRTEDTMVVKIEPSKNKRGPFINRETYFNIAENAFEMKSEQSYDDGKTWEKGNYSMVVSRTLSD